MALRGEGLLLLSASFLGRFVRSLGDSRPLALLHVMVPPQVGLIVCVLTAAALSSAVAADSFRQKHVRVTCHRADSKEAQIDQKTGEEPDMVWPQPQGPMTEVHTSRPRR